jgi:hypothetical protein
MEKKLSVVAIWCEHAFAIYDSKPIVDKYKKSGIKVLLITENQLRESAKSYLGLDDEFIFPFEKFNSSFGAKLGAYITYYFRVFCVPLNFSDLYFQRAKIKLGDKQKIFGRDIKFFNLKRSKINDRYHQLLSLFYSLKLIKGIDIKFDKIYVFTKVSKPYLLVPFKDKITLLIESWDHPSQEPFLVNPKVTLSWNKDLCEEIREYQGFNEVYTLEPLKFRYIHERAGLAVDDLAITLRKKEFIQEIKLFDENDIIIYPMCTSSTYFAFEGEVKFLEELSAIISLTNYKLYIRPYPLAPKQDAERLQKLPNVIVGYYDNFHNGLEMLDEESMTHKYLIMKKAAAIINLGTTFVLDSALVNDSIIQLFLSSDEYGDFSSFSKGVHIKKYLLIEGSQEYSGDTNDLLQIIRDIDNQYAKRLRNWLMDIPNKEPKKELIN